MQRLFANLLLVAILFMVGGRAASAATISHYLSISGVYDNSTGMLLGTDAATINAGLASGQPFIYRVDIKLLLTGPIAVGESYGAEAFSLTLTPGLTRLPAHLGDARAYYRSNRPIISTGVADPTIYDQYGNAINGIDYFLGIGINRDASTSSTDLQAIFTGIDPTTLNNIYSSADGGFTLTPIMPDPRTQIGIGSPFLLGQIWVRYIGLIPSSIYLDPFYYNPIVFDKNENKYTFGKEQHPQTTLMLFGYIPEPSTLILMGLGAIGLMVAARRRR